MSEKLVKDKKSEKLYFKGTGVTYHFSREDSKWSLQVSNQGLISILWKYFYKEKYTPVSSKEIVVFRFHDYRFEEIAQFIENNYKPSLEVVK